MRLLLFNCNRYESNGGIWDAVAVFHDLEAAKYVGERYAEDCNPFNPSHQHILDLDTFAVYKFERDSRQWSRFNLLLLMNKKA